MKHIYLFTVTIFASALAQIPMLYAQEYELVWSDEFNGSQLDTSVWQYELGGGSNNELQYYTSRPNNIFVADGKLTIKAVQESYGGKNYTSARINSSGKFNFKYGKIEAYMKLTYGQGMWPAFWTLGEAFHEVGWPGCGEIDIMEQVGGVTANGKGDDVIHSTLHWGQIINNGHPYYGQSYQLPEGIFADEFHLVSTVWDKDFVRTYCDSILFFTIDLRSAEFDAFEKNFFIIMNLAVGGDWPGNPDATTVFPQTFEIDYVRLYKSDATITIEGPEEVFASDSSLQYSIFGGDTWTYEWLLPEGASINGIADSNVLNLNWGCSPANLRCHITSSVFNDTVSLNINIKEPAIEGPLFFTPGETGLEFSFPALHNTSYLWSVTGDATIVSGENNPSVVVDWGLNSDTVKLEIQNTCGTSSYYKALLPEGQYSYPDPFVPHSVPGIIQSTDYDYGGEGVAYHDSEAANQGPGPRPEEGVDTENNDGGSNIGWINSGEWTEYTVAVVEDGNYKIDIRVASQNTSGISPLNIYFNGDNRTGNITIPSTGAWNSFTTITASPIMLYTSDTLMRLDFGDGGYNVGRISIATFIPDDNSEIMMPETLQLFPNPSTGNTWIASHTAICELSVMDMSGRIQLQLSKIFGNSVEIETEGLSPGIYLIRAAFIDGTMQTLKLIKSQQ
jgi:beta-glucanase (GH16 family)